ncbi:WD40 repeat domain-containing protein [Candidatus Uabimicrobium amorphum]|uniref:Uncharacterized protein n=1 Tax=Uabimicrobium amorphum TaxID=2596890 RepID=A0A5S9F4Z7_UABAM|nr:WD40 repeat domain-containing protein [Candidatus Uabimicrobium amorphum]BBM85771.1 hypothetical protein UABAM_04149 [Candidatus Uabimicrobium amorphum]
MDKNSHNEYLYFKCENGHENYVFKKPDENTLQKKQWIVECQHCDWKSQPFFPQLFQHNSQGNFLLWIYTTKDVNAVHSVFNLEVASQAKIVNQAQASTPAKEATPTPEKQAAQTPKKEAISPVKETAAIPTPTDIKLDKSVEKMPKRRPATIKMPIMNRSMLKEEEDNPLEQVFEELAPPTVPQKRARQQTVKMPVMNRSMLADDDDDEEDREETVSVKSPVTERKVLSESAKKKAKLRETVKIQKKDLLKEIEKPSVVGSQNQIASPQEMKESVEDTIEVSIKDLGLQEVKNDRVEESTLQHNRIKLQQNYAAILILNFLWLLVFTSVVMLAYHFFDEQNNKIAQALYSVKGEIANIEFPEFPEFPQLQIPAENAEDKKWQEEYQKVYRQYRDAIKNLQKEKDSVNKRERSYRALLVTYRETQKKNSDLQKELQKIRDANYKLQKEILHLEKQKKKTVDTPPTQGKELNTKMTALSEKEQDFYFPLVSDSGKYMIFYRNEDAGRKRVRRYLKLAFLTDQGVGEEFTLYETPVVRLKNGEVPFVYDWNGRNRIVLLTRIKGINSIHRIQLRVDENNQQVSVQTRELVKTKYPITLGPPSLSPNQQFFAYIYNKDRKTQVHIRDMLTGSLQHSISGGGDTLRAPLWSSNSRYLLFPANDLRGIISWEISRSKRVKKLDADIYGRYLSMSPDGSQLMFLQSSSSGKGNVDICVWDWQNLQSPIEKWVTNTRSTESCKIVWLNQYFAYIGKGEKDKIILVDYKKRQQHEVFAKQGRIDWVSKLQNDDILFSYREGLFSRPYTIQVKEE